MKQLILNLAVFFLGFLFFVSPSHAESQIIWMGCGITEKAFMGKIAEGFTKKTGITFRKSGGGATKGIRLTSSGNAQIGATCRHVLVDENNKVIPEEANVRLVHVAWDALVMITHEENPVNGLTSRQVKDISSGKITNWKEVGGNDEDIVLVTREGKTSGVGLLFRLLVLHDKNFNFPSNSVEFKSSGPVEKNIAFRFKNGIGVTGISSAQKRAVKILSLDGTFPSKENIASGEYPFFRPLYMAVPKNPDKSTDRLIDFILSPEGQAIISAEGTVNLKEGKPLKEKWHLTHLE